ncbi:MAG: response regulator transcription factor [Caldilineaceae bacterium]|nr:response regulator transcription factor [Caldilineaceae bacterium]
MSEPIRILIVDDHDIVRLGLSALIATEPTMLLAGEAEDGMEAVLKARALRPDVILMDLAMPRKDGIEAIHEIKNDHPDARILVITSFAEDEKVFPAIKAGAQGYLLKDSSPQELLQAIYDVHNGESSLDPAIARKLLRELNRPVAPAISEEALTEREIEVIKLLAQGLANGEIARQLVITERTVRSHVGSILSKLHLANRTQAALYALRQGLIPANQDPPLAG